MEFIVPDMTCGHCAGVITRALKDSDPACTVVIDLPAHRVTIESTQDRDSLRQALIDAGYTPG